MPKSAPDDRPSRQKGVFRMRVSAELQSAWTQLWNTGSADSLPADRAAGRLGALDSAWKEFFSGFPDGARLLDLATGGGDVIRGATALGRNFNITGVDLADLAAVAAKLQIAAITLVGNTDLSKLPFPDAAFDGVTSQFGIEYADVAAAAHEAVRILAPGGRGHFVLHHAESAITQGAVKSFAAYRSVFPDNRAFRTGRTVFECHRRSAPRAETEEAEADFRRATGELQPRVRSDPAFEVPRKLVALLSDLAAAPFLRPANDALRMIDQAEEQVGANNLRKRAQIDAALDRSGIDKLSRSLSAAGAVVDAPQELKYPIGTLMAWSVSFHR
jgi:SAM-dependent methyltransferase